MDRNLIWCDGMPLVWHRNPDNAEDYNDSNNYCYHESSPLYYVAFTSWGIVCVYAVITMMVVMMFVMTVLMTVFLNVLLTSNFFCSSVGISMSFFN